MFGTFLAANKSVNLIGQPMLLNKSITSSIDSSQKAYHPKHKQKHTFTRFSNILFRLYIAIICLHNCQGTECRSMPIFFSQNLCASSALWSISKARINWPYVPIVVPCPLLSIHLITWRRKPSTMTYKTLRKRS